MRLSKIHGRIALLKRQRGFFLPFGGGGAGVTAPAIKNSLRLRSGSYGSRVWGTPTNANVWACHLWLKKCKNGASQVIVSNSGGSDELYFLSDDSLSYYNGGSYTSSGKYRDNAGFLPVCIRSDGTYIKTYVKGVEVASKTGTPAALNANGITHYFGRDNNPAIAEFVVAQICWVDGQAPMPSAFETTDAAGEIRAKTAGAIRAAVSAGGGARNGWGAQGGLWDFTDIGSTTTLGYDHSQSDTDTTGNNLTFTGVSLSGTTNDALIDSPSNDSASGTRPVGCYATWNPTDNGGPTLSNAGLTAAEAGSGTACVLSTLAVDALAYAEFTVATLGGNIGIRVGQRDDGGNCRSYNYCLNTTGSFSNGEANVPDAYNGTVYTAVSTNDVLMVAANKTTGKLWFGVNGTWVGSGDPAAGTNPTLTPPTTDTWRFAFHRNSATGGVVHANFGQRPFSYTPPTGFKALCSTNLPQPTVNPLTAHKITLATGANIDSDVAAARSGWSDYVEIKKNRDAAGSWLWQFSHDGSNEYAIAASSVTRQAKSSLSGSNNYLGRSIRIGAAYGTAAGSVAHTSGADTTVTHNVGVSARQMIFLFPRAGGTAVKVYHPDLASGKLLNLCSGSDETTDATIKTVTSNSFKIDSTVASGTYDYLVMSELTGLLELGKHTGNGSSDGPCDNEGISVEAFMLKSNTIASDNWRFFDAKRDPYNPYYHSLSPSTNAAENVGTANRGDFLSAGVKIHSTDVSENYSGATYIYAMHGRAATALNANAR